MKVSVTMSIDGTFVCEVEVPENATHEDIHKAAEAMVAEADFGDLEDIHADMIDSDPDNSDDAVLDFKRAHCNCCGENFDIQALPIECPNCGAQYDGDKPYIELFR